MTDYEAVTELKSQTGVSYAEAKDAYENSGKDMLAALISIEKNSSSCRRERKFMNEDMKKKVKKNAGKAATGLMGFLAKLSRNNLTVSGSREYFTVPLIAAVIVALATIEIFVPVTLIALVCGISFTITGPDFNKQLTLGFKGNDVPVVVNAQPSKYAYTDNISEVSDKGFFNK